MRVLKYINPSQLNEDYRNFITSLWLCWNIF